MKQILFFTSLIAFIGGLIIAQQYFSKRVPPSSKQIPIAGKTFGGEFTLQPDGGKAVSLSDFRGKVVVVYFGFTSCPDVCPTSLAVISNALKSLPADEVADVQGLFISLDPERDTGAKLKQYAQYFHKNIMGVTGTVEQVTKVARQYGTYFTKVAGSSDTNYLIDHTSATFIIGKDGKFATSKSHGATAEQITEAIRSAL
ncbi:MAG: SCO family protein [Leucothrix sp.]